jgi:hypothetical protein
MAENWCPMSAQAAVAIILSSAGGLSELLGLIVVAREIRSDRQRGERLLQRLDEPRRPERSYPPRMLGAGPTPEYANPVYATSMHLRGVINDLQQTKVAVANGFLGLRKAIDADIDAAVEVIERDVAERDSELRDGLRYVLAGSVRERWNGVMLLALGISLGAAGSVIGNLG